MADSRQKLNMQARNAAVHLLIAAHPDEWEQIYGDERAARGLPREITKESLEWQNMWLRNRIRELEHRLGEAGGEKPALAPAGENNP